MTTPCDHYRQQIAKALLNDLSSQEQQDLTTHLAQCPACTLEQELSASAVEQLRSVPDVPVPRHFFVYPEARQSSPWHLLGQMRPFWKLAAAAVVSVVIVGAGFVAANFHFQAENGVYSFSFGKPLPARVSPLTAGAPLTALKLELLAAMDERIRSERLQTVQMLQSELGRSATGFNRQQRQLLQTALQNMETRMNGQIASTRTVLEARNDRELASLYAAWQTQRAEDLTHLSASLNRVVTQGAAKEKQTDAILDTLLQVAELRMR